MPEKIRLSRLRDIGWTLWDPIGLLPSGERWDDEENLPFADEYDGYLIRAAGQVRRGASDADVVAYLLEAETMRMGLAADPKSRERATRVVAAIRADDRLWTSADPEGRV